jgi:hypothetical protein
MEPAQMPWRSDCFFFGVPEWDSHDSVLVVRGLANFSFNVVAIVACKTWQNVLSVQWGLVAKSVSQFV